MEVEFREQFERCKELLEKYPQGMALANLSSCCKPYMHHYRSDDLASKAVTSADKALAQLER